MFAPHQPWKVKVTQLPEGARISTSFLGMHYGIPDEEPLLFESIFFDKDGGGFGRRYHTWEEAAAGHEEIIKLCETGGEISYQMKRLG